jgi:CelD/BcsL family acetyltransferase involved in cellulose biosynthesis
MIWSTELRPFPLTTLDRKAWDALAGGEDGHPQRSWWWAECWLKHFPVCESNLLVVLADGVPRAMVPLVVLQERDPHMPWRHRVRSLTGDGFSDALPVLVRPDDHEALIRIADVLDAGRATVDESRLSPLIEEEAGADLRLLLEKRGWTAERVEGNPLLSLEDGWEGLRTRLGQNLRKDVGKKKRRLVEAGIAIHLQLERRCSDDLLRELTDLARHRFEHEGHKSAFLDPTRRAFIGAIAHEAAQRGVFACYLGRDGQRLVGYRFGFLAGGVFYDWITSYEPELFPYSIGKLLLWDIIEHLCAEGATHVNFMAGEEDYKLKWQPEVRSMYRCRILSPTLVNRSRQVLRALSRLKQSWM